MLSTKDAAARLGMAVHEVVAVVPTEDGDVVVTHDGTKTLITADGELFFEPPPTAVEQGKASALKLSDDGEVTLSTHDAAKLLGMAEHEIVGVHASEAGHIVVTHDGTPTLVAEDGKLVFGATAIAARLGALEEPAADDQATPLGEGDQTPAMPPAGDVVPDGTIEVVLAWVGEDKDRATQALDAERVRPAPRSGLLTKLEALAGA
jgi:glycerophosphoryl diester phosphodiesterase